ncbi:hypothetical protein F2P81_006076 [Scophthalmus maximus]|uniref:Uncharacterized protein n=1 Tax=Scophthalmus maximus TaxID=52904 RepID=A0A6A4TH25_SCOMX|nr:hypothetical protein F2P81_006076 [Scophthalmus maximus]
MTWLATDPEINAKRVGKSSPSYGYHMISKQLTQQPHVPCQSATAVLICVGLLAKGAKRRWTPSQRPQVLEHVGPKLCRVTSKHFSHFTLCVIVKGTCCPRHGAASFSPRRSGPNCWPRGYHEVEETLHSHLQQCPSTQPIGVVAVVKVSNVSQHWLSAGAAIIKGEEFGSVFPD